MRSKSRAKRSNTELNPLIGDFINTIDPSLPFDDQICCDAQHCSYVTELSDRWIDLLWG
jgi:hypothetical protein